MIGNAFGWRLIHPSLVIDYIRRPSLVPWQLRVRWFNYLYQNFQMHFRLSHIFLEGNKVVDALANYNMMFLNLYGAMSLLLFF